ncbi:hypothetical protein ABZT43_18895 [Streptomyces sp. NPDC005349]|uniref:hypothetical protein n=1 Tax=Streptomyces sp. NPDC005349 TaxID=3157037 RepID=UPI0033BF193E
MYWSYGAHNLSSQYGDHWFVNNLYGGASASLCKAYNGATCHLPPATCHLPPATCHLLLDAQYGQYAESVDLTSYNSITLNR